MSAFTAETLTYWIAHGAGMSTGVLRPGQAISSGEEHLETFTRYRPYLTRWIQLGGTPETAAPLEQA